MELGQAEILALFLKNLSFGMGLIKCLGQNQGLVEVITNLERNFRGLREGEPWKETWDRWLCRLS